MKTKKLIAILIAVCMTFGILPITSFAENEVHVISSVGDWEAFAAHIAKGEYTTDTWELDADISVTVKVNTTDYTSHATVGTEAHPFAGTFDGHGHTLTVDIRDEYYLNEQTNPGAAPFRFIAGATIKNLTVKGYVAGAGHTAGLVSYNQSGSSVIENCLVYTDVTRNKGANQRTGGVLGHNNSSVITMRNVVYGGTLINSEYTHNVAGGLIGWSDRSTVILDNCLFNGSFTGNLEAFSPILIQNPSIDSILHDGISATYNNVYYTVEPTDTFDEHTIGQYFINDTVSRFVYAGIPENAIYEPVTGPDGLPYNIPCTVEGVQANYRINGDYDYTVKNFNGETLNKDVHYTESLTRGGTPVNYISIAGDYVLTLTGKGGYTGSYTQTLHVYDEVPYVYTDGTTRTVERYTVVTPGENDWRYATFGGRGWYAVFGNVTVKGRIEVNNNINLILCDGATLTVEQGIGVGQYSSLTIWSQSGGSGVLNAVGTESSAGIGSYKVDDFTYKSGGAITINGGVINATAGASSTAIGGGASGLAESVTINGGNVTARGASWYSGIGDTGTTTINDGTVTAYGGSGGAGIGGGWDDGCGNITINGGTVTGYGGDYGAAGIGGGRGGDGGTININGGVVRAYGGPPEDIPTARRVDIGDPRGNAQIKLNYTEESAETMNVKADYWLGPVKIVKTFYDKDSFEEFDVTDVADNNALSGKTLIPGSNVRTIIFHKGDGTGEMADVHVLKGSEYTLPECTFIPPKPARTFVCWLMYIDGEGSVIKYPGDVVTVNDDVQLTARFRTEYALLQDLIDEAADGSTITLEHDYISEKSTDTVFTVPAGKNVTIDLAGHTIDRKALPAADGNIFNVKGTLTVTDTSDGKTGTIKGGNTTGSGGAFYVPAGGTLIINNANITNNRAVNGGAICSNGTVIFNDGSIANNTAVNSGGGIFVNNNGTLVLAGGSITGNTAAANYHGGGIHTSGTMYVSGDPVVRDNTRGGKTNNVGLYDGAVINVAGPLSEDASIGVNKSRGGSAVSDTGVVTSGLSGNGTAWVFKADGEDQHVLPFEGEASIYPSDIYYINIVPCEHGNVSVDSLYAKEGDRLGFVSESDSGCRERSFEVRDDAGNKVNVSYGDKYWVYMPASNITVTAVFEPYYLINVDKNTPHGTIDLEWAWSYAGEKVPLSASPDKNYRLSEWLVTDADGNPVETADGGFIMPEKNVTVSAVFESIPNEGGPVPYVDANGDDMTPATAYTVVGPNTRLDTTGWYVVKDNVGVGRQIIYGDVNIILCDGVTLTVNYGIALDDGASLTVWSQKNGTGGLRVENIKIEEAPGIRGFGNSIMTVNGGNIYAEGYKGAGNRFDDPSGGPGIYIKNLVINGGNVEAAGGWHAAGIGGGEGKSGENVIINGGYVKATGGLDGAGIGGGNGGSGGNITINGGTVDAVSGGSSAGIGGGYNGSGGNITINGGTVVAAGYNGGAGIGGGRNGTGGNVTGGKIAINGGNVKATSYYNGNQPSHGIGTGSGSKDAEITLSWTNRSDSIYANSYGGHIVLLKLFIDEKSNYYGSGIEFTDGKAELYGSEINGKTLTPSEPLTDVGGNSEDNTNPQTGDDLFTLLFIMIIAAVSMTALIVYRKYVMYAPKHR